jgi:hypothetical protein
MYKNKIEMKGAPEQVNGHFICERNSRLKSFKHCPSLVEGDYLCADNGIESLEGMPAHINKSFICAGNKLKTLKGAPTTVEQHFDCSRNKELKSLDGAPKHVGTWMNCTNNPNISKEEIEKLRSKVTYKIISDYDEV